MNRRIRAAIASARAVVFDFDGTLVDSTAIKLRGFEEVFAAYPDRMAEIREYCGGWNHTVRGEKFRHVCENILQIPYSQALDESFHAAYAAATVDAVAQAPEIPGAFRFVRSLGGDFTALLSSTLHESLVETLEKRGVGRLFSVVQGAPINKRDWLIGLQDRLGCASREIVFFGDTDEDAASGVAAGCVFVRVANAPAAPDELFIKDFQSLSG